MDWSKIKGKKVLCALSGGVDSSMMAILIKQHGGLPIGITMKLGDTKIRLGNTMDSSCCTLDDINDARAIATKYDFPHYIIDLKAEFEKNVIDDFVDRTLAGFTPNPCIVCNKTVKWGSLMKYVNGLGCDYLATGHYARINHNDDRYFLSRPRDLTKDQTYFLWALSQADLSRTIFPLGNYLKLDIKSMAMDLGFDVFKDKGESFDICFVGDATYKDFMLVKYPHLKNLDGGDIVLADGTVVGKHAGHPFYTVGQRKGLGVSLGTPSYVLSIDSINNRLVVGPIDALKTNTAIINDVNLMKYNKIIDGIECVAKVRSLDKGTNAKLYNIDNGRVRVDFLSDVKGGVCYGQSIVMYDNDDVIGGGFIVKDIQK